MMNAPTQIISAHTDAMGLKRRTAGRCIRVPEPRLARDVLNLVTVKPCVVVGETFLKTSATFSGDIPMVTRKEVKVNLPTCAKVSPMRCRIIKSHNAGRKR